VTTLTIKLLIEKGLRLKESTEKAGVGG